MDAELLIKKTAEKLKRKVCANCGSDIAVRVVQCMDRPLPLCIPCCGRLPEALWRHTKMVTAAELAEVARTVASIHIGTFIEDLEGLDGLEGFELCSESVGINGIYYPFEAIRSFKFRFVPIRRLNQKNVLGYPYAVVELDSPHMLVQEPLSRKPVIFRAFVEDGKALFLPSEPLCQAEKAISDVAGKKMIILKKEGRLEAIPAVTPADFR